MKIDQSTQISSWGAGAARRFADSPLGQQVVARLQQGSRSQRSLSDFILRDPVFVATHGIEDVARVSGISTSTISRYVRDLQLTGYGEFRAGVAETVHALIAPVAKLESRMTESAAAQAPAEQSLAAALHQLQGLTDGQTIAALRAVAGQLRDARQVWILGFGLSAHLAAMLALGLQPYRDGIFNVVEFGGTEVAAGRLMSCGPGDVLLAISFPRYSSDITDLARAGQSMGADLVVLTDSPASPLAQLGGQLLLAPAQHPYLSSSSLPGLAMIEALLSEFLLSDPAHIERAGRLAALLSSYLDPVRGPAG